MIWKTHTTSRKGREGGREEEGLGGRRSSGEGGREGGGGFGRVRGESEFACLVLTNRWLTKTFQRGLLQQPPYLCDESRQDGQAQGGPRSASVTHSTVFGAPWSPVTPRAYMHHLSDMGHTSTPTTVSSTRSTTPGLSAAMFFYCNRKRYLLWQMFSRQESIVNRSLPSGLHVHLPSVTMYR